MGFLPPREPDLHLAGWWPTSFLRRVAEPARAPGGDPAPRTPYLAPAAKLLVFAAVSVLVITAAPAIGGSGDIPSWSSLIAYQKVVVWALLWQLLGLGQAASAPGSALRLPTGALRYFLRPGTIRLPPWPDRFVATGGTRRGAVDVFLYAVVVLLGVALLVSGAGHDTLPYPLVWALLLCLGALGLRDRTAFLAARPQLYGVMMLVFTFPPQDMVFSLKLCMVAMWWGAAAARVHRRGPLDLAATAVEFVVPVVLLTARGGWVTVAAIAGMIAFHLLVAVRVRTGRSLEWTAVVVYSTVVLFGHDAGVGRPTLASWPLISLLVVLLVVPIVIGVLKPHTMSSRWLHGGNRATSLWLFRDDGAESLLAATLPDPPAADDRRRAVHGLLGRAVEDPARYRVHDGEAVAAAALGLALGDGHLHDGRLLTAVQERCGFTAGQLRVITLEAQPLLRRTQHYRILDAASGQLEAGQVRASDIVVGPGSGDVTIPVEVTFRVLPPVAMRVYPAPARPRPVPRAPLPMTTGLEDVGVPQRARPRPRPSAIGADGS